MQRYTAESDDDDWDPSDNDNDNTHLGTARVSRPPTVTQHRKWGFFTKHMSTNLLYLLAAVQSHLCQGAQGAPGDVIPEHSSRPRSHPRAAATACPWDSAHVDVCNSRHRCLPTRQGTSKLSKSKTPGNDISTKEEAAAYGCLPHPPFFQVSTYPRKQPGRRRRQHSLQW